MRKEICVIQLILTIEWSSILSVDCLNPHLSATIEPDSQTVDIGNEAVFTCIITGHPVKSVMWLKNGQPLKTGGRVNLISRDTIRIDSVQKADEGNYQCFIANDLETAHGSSQLHTRESPPQFVETFNEEILEQGVRISLKCGATGNPLPQITWTLDNQAIREAYHIRIGDYVSDVYMVNSYVNISAAKIDDGGSYTCKASNSAGDIAYSRRINVIGPPHIRPMPNVTGLSNQNIHVQCPYSGYPIKSISWLREGRRLPQNHRQKVFNNNGSLIINNVEKSADAARYECLVVDGDGRSAKRDLFINVVVSPVVDPFSFPSDLIAGRRAGAACIVSAGDLPIRISWLKDALSIPPHLHPVIDTKDFTSFLTFEKVSKEHSGQYTCLAENPAASSNYTAPLLVQVPPSWVVEPKDVSVIKGHSITLDCQADGSPLPIIRWKKSIDGGDFKVIISNAHIQTLENGSLTIRDVIKEDAGQYMCQAINGVGPGTSTVVKMTVNVAAHFEKKFESLTYKKGDEATLKCRVIGEKDIRITWSRDHQAIHGENEPRYVFQQSQSGLSAESILRISSVDRRDSALFTCHGENSFGKDAMNLQVLIQEPPDCPGDLRAADIASRSLALLWTHPYSGNLPIVNYIVEYKSSSFSAQGKDTLARESVPSNVATYLIKGLHPLTTYSVVVIAQNSLGSSTLCAPLTVTTDGEAPSAPPRDIKVVPLSSTSLQVTWRAPTKSQQNGPIQGYYVGYRLDRSSNDFAYKTVETKQEDNGEETCQISDLRKLTRYIVVVQAYNKKGAGPPSEPIEAQTLEFDPPSPPILKVISAGHRSVLLAWEPTDSDVLMNIGDALTSSSLSASSSTDPMTGYTLFHRVEKGDWQEMPIFPDKLSYNVSNLHCGKRYQFYMIMSNSAGRGLPSEVISAKTLGTAPIAPDSHDFIMANSTFTVVNLSSWNTGGCQILNFNIQYKLKSQRDYILLSSNLLPEQRTYLIADLKPATWYNLFVTAYNEAGSTGAEYTFATLTMSGEPIPPPIPNNLEEIAHQLKLIVPLISTLLVMLLILGVVCSIFKKRQNFASASFTATEDTNKSCEAMPLSDWDSCKRPSLRQAEETSGYFNSNSGLKSHAPSNDQIYYPSPYALSRISVYERSLIPTDGHHLHSHSASGQHTYDVPIKKCLINSGYQVVLNQNKSPDHHIIDPSERRSSQEKLYERLERRDQEKYDFSGDYPSSSAYIQPRKKRKNDGQESEQSDSMLFA